jgi:hypothetical protein
MIPGAMTTSNLQVRRATVEDLPTLLPLWREDRLPWQDLENRFKEFQVVQNSEGTVLGGIGLQIVGLEGLLHSEVFAHPEQADLLRDLLWERVQIIAANHGLVRIWTQLSTPFWYQNGLKMPSPETLAKLPAAFGRVDACWLFLQLRDDTVPAISLDAQFEQFKAAEQEETAKLYRHARVMKLIAGILGLAVFALVVIWAVLFIKAQGRLPPPPH